MTSIIDPIYGGLPHGWRYVTLGQLVADGDADLQTGPFGTMLHASAYRQHGTPVVAVQHIGDNRLRHDDLPRIDDADRDRLERYLLHDGDILFGRKGAVERRAIVTEEEDGWLQGSDCIRIRFNPAVVDPWYISYVLGAQPYREWIVRNAQGATMPSLNQEIIGRIPVPFAPLTEQRAIAAICCAFEARIHLNRRANETLESIPRAIFKSWFVDFDPARAKAEGRQPAGMDTETARLFPTAWRASSVGPIPAGWQVAEIRERASRIQYGFTQSASAEPVGPHFLRITDIQGGKVDWSTVPFCRASPNECEKYHICPGDILVARTGASTGENVYIVGLPDALFASYLVRFQFEQRSIARVVAEFMRTEDYFGYVAGVLGGSAQPNASGQVLAGAELAFPPTAIADAFLRFVDPLDRARMANSAQASTLASVRDALLPKLLSGELRIRDAEKMVEAHV